MSVMLRWACYVVMAGSLVCGCASVKSRATSAPVQPAVRYLALLRVGIDRTRKQIPMITESAHVAARRIIAGARLYADGSQPDFALELINRAGGLTGIDRVPQKVNRGDVILYGAQSKLNANDFAKITRWQSQGVYVIAFTSATLSANPYFKPDATIDSGPDEGLVLANGRLCPADTVINFVNVWTWTAEFFAACTREGRTPVLNLSFGIPGGYARATKYRDRVFHDDIKVPAIASGLLANRYLDAIERCIGNLETESAEAMSQAGQWVREAGPRACAVEVFAYTFPSHYRDARAPQPFSALSGEGAKWPPRGARVVVAIGYQQPQQLLIDAAHDRRMKLVYSSVERARDDRSRSIIYIDPCWPIEDACVAVKGYDIPILPSSGILQAAIYWSVAAEAVGVKPRTDDGGSRMAGAPIRTSNTPGE
jgi:hypothetical protein